MQKIDLLEHHQNDIQDRAQVCIIGAGAAGLFLAHCLTALGIDVILLEAGSERCVKAEEQGFLPLFTGSAYGGAVDGRAFGFGGSTALWGGALVPYTAYDLRHTHDCATANVWEHIVRTVSHASGEVLQALGLDETPDFETYADQRLAAGAMLRSLGLGIVTPVLLPFGRRNFSFLADSDAMRNRAKVYLNAVASSWRGNERRIESVTATTPGGKAVTVAADRFVVAAGALESARMLLEIREDCPQANIHAEAAIGAYLSDHISAPVAVARAAEGTRAAKLFAPRFFKGCMRTFYMLDGKAEGEARRGFFHFVFDMEENPGFHLAREVLQALQGRRWPAIDVRMLLKGIGGLSALAFHRYARRRLYVPPNTVARLHLDIEQAPSKTRALSLTHTHDRYGRRQAEIRWSIGDDDHSTITAGARRVLEQWSRDGSLPRLHHLAPDTAESRPYDIYHPVGTCRMGMDADAVTDLDLKVKGTENLWVLSTGLFPSSGSANPTFSMLCLGVRLAARLAAGRPVP